MKSRLTPIALCLASVVLIIAVVLAGSQGERNVMVKLGHNHDLRISAFEAYRTVGTTPAIPLTQLETLEYLTKAFREPVEMPFSGVLCHADIRLSDGSEHTVYLIIPLDGASLAVGVDQGILKDPKYYTVKLMTPVPAELAELLNEMTKLKRNIRWPN